MVKKILPVADSIFKWMFWLCFACCPSLWFMKEVVQQKRSFRPATVSPKRKYTLLLSQVLKTEGSKFIHQLHRSQWESLEFAIFPVRGCLRLFVLVSLSLGISKWGLVHFWPTQVGVWCTPYFSSSHPGLWVRGFAASVYFLLVETVSPLCTRQSKN